MFNTINRCRERVSAIVLSTSLTIFALLFAPAGALGKTQFADIVVSCGWANKVKPKLEVAAGNTIGLSVAVGVILAVVLVAILGLLGIVDSIRKVLLTALAIVCFVAFFLSTFGVGLLESMLGAAC